MAGGREGYLDKIRIVIIGETGTGKSETANSILLKPDAFKSEASASSVTKDCKLEQQNVFGTNVLVVDTPGLFDTETPNKDMILRIVQCVFVISPGPHAILLTIKPTRLTQQIKDTVDTFKRFFGEHANKYMIVVFTHKDGLTTRRGTKTIQGFVSEIQDTNMVKGLLRQCGMRYVAFNNYVEPDSAENKQQVQALLDMIQKMVKDNGGSHYNNEMLEAAEKVMKQREAQLGSRSGEMVSSSWTDIVMTMLPHVISAVTSIANVYMQTHSHTNVHVQHEFLQLTELFRNMKIPAITPKVSQKK